MLFNSIEFIYYFLPCTVIIYYLTPPGYRFLVLVAASIFFYSWWNPAFTPLLLASIAINFLVHTRVVSALTTGNRVGARIAAVSGIALNLSTLGFFKYRSFLATSIGLGDLAVGTDIVLPLAISFFTFQQIAFLIDTWRGQVSAVSPFRYAAYISFFPQLIAGPIVRHNEILPQLSRPGVTDIADNLAIGSGLFIVGLFKKVVLADGAAMYATPVFSSAIGGVTPSAFDAWTGLLAYHFQIYFDFSGYSNMAIGLAKMFGLNLPLNFRSPYKADSVIEFWRRWHMTLSRFLRDYLYIPLGGSRNGTMRRYSNVMITMLLGGLWHGAAWGFVLWGGLHGICVVINHAWRSVSGEIRVPRIPAVGLTFLVVLLAWVPFRLEDLSVTMLFYSSLIGFAGECAPVWTVPVNDAAQVILFLTAMALIVWLFPTAEQVFGYERTDDSPALGVAWQPSMVWAFLLGAAFFISVALTVFVGDISEFLYFQF